MKSKAIISTLIIIMSVVITGCAKQADMPVEETTSTAVVDTELLANISGEYIISDSSILENEICWALAIYKDDSNRNVFSIYDTVGNPGLYGEIIGCSDSEIKLEIDYDYYEQMPCEEWSIEDEKYITIGYSVNEYTITVENNNATIEFVKQPKM